MFHTTVILMSVCNHLIMMIYVCVGGGWGGGMYACVSACVRTSCVCVREFVRARMYVSCVRARVYV
jgi:hypothetical protein